MKKGIDVSSHQGIFPWDKVKDQIDFAIIRSSHGIMEIDAQFERNYSECKRLNIPVGCYHYFYYKDADKHEDEMKNFISRINGKEFELPCFIDYEEYKVVNPNTLGWLDRVTLTDYAMNDIERLNSLTFVGGIYANKNWLTNKLQPARFSINTPIWLAEYNSKVTYTGRYDMWQYSSSGSLTGYGGKLDMNIMYKDLTFKKSMPVEQPIHMTVKKGMFNNEVKVMQQMLKDRAYTITVDGDFGVNTETVLKRFQVEKGLVADGICGANTWARLDNVRQFSKIKDGEMFLSKNFQVKEFACKDGSDKILICMDNVNFLQQKRDSSGKPIRINSAYRTEYWNAVQGGEKNSLHMKGLAIDFTIDGEAPSVTQQNLQKVHNGGIGCYKTFSHIDDGRKRTWRG